MSKYNLGAASDIGYERESQEDFVQFKELDENNMLAVIADGTGSIKNYLQPGVMVGMSIINDISDIYKENKDLFISNPLFFVKRAVINANNFLGAFKLGNEELLSGYASSITVALFTEDNRIHLAHSGNTRLYILRNSRIIPMTKDHTEAQVKFDEGEIDEETYYVHPGRLKLTSGIGLMTNPEIDCMSGKLKEDDIIIMTTDGIHYAIRPEHIMNIVFESQDVVPACNNLINAAKNIIKYPDNMSAIVVGFNK